MFVFGDSFDLYAALADATGYWDAVNVPASLVAGRFSGQALSLNNNTFFLTKNSAVNDAVHHICIAFKQTAALSGSTLTTYLQLLDGATAQCSIVFKSNGDILLASGGATGTVLATYTGAVTGSSIWTAFEFEVVIHNTAGSFKVRKDGASTDSFSAASLDTQSSANAYANALKVGINTSVNAQQIDDLFWKSDASSVAWMGDIRCYTRMPVSDQTTVFSRSPATNTQTPVAQTTTGAIATGTARYTKFTAAYNGTIGTATVSLAAGYTGNMKCAIFADQPPTTVLGSATIISNPVTGTNTFTFLTPIPVVAGSLYTIGFSSDTSSGTWNVGSGATNYSSTTSYASFPAASPSTAAAGPIVCSIAITTTSCTLINETQQDGTTSYVYSATPGDADFYGIATIPTTPATVIAVTARGYMSKSDAGARTACIQMKSGATTVASTTLTLSTSFLWAWRTDVTDPATSLPWTPAAVNAAQIGPKCVA